MCCGRGVHQGRCRGGVGSRGAQGKEGKARSEWFLRPSSLPLTLTWVYACDQAHYGQHAYYSQSLQELGVALPDPGVATRVLLQTTEVCVLLCYCCYLASAAHDLQKPPTHPAHYALQNPSSPPPPPLSPIPPPPILESASTQRTSPEPHPALLSCQVSSACVPSLSL